MLNSIISTLKVVVSTLYYSIHCITGSKGDPDKFQALTVEWAEKLLAESDTRLEVSGLENIPQSASRQSYVYIANHSSLMDIPVVLAAIHDGIRIIYKKELEKIPIFGTGLRRSPFIPVSRGSGKSAASTLGAAIAEMKKNRSILIFPEGTRSVDGNVAEFHRGAFLMAAKADKMLVPVSISGTINILPKKAISLKPGCTVKVHFSAPLDVPNGSRAEMLAFMESLRETIANHIEKI